MGGKDDAEGGAGDATGGKDGAAGGNDDAALRWSTCEDDEEDSPGGVGAGFDSDGVVAVECDGTGRGSEA